MRSGAVLTIKFYNTSNIRRSNNAMDSSGRRCQYLLDPRWDIVGA